MEQHKETLALSDFIDFPLFFFKWIGATLYKYHPEERIPLWQKIALLCTVLNLAPHFICFHSFPFCEDFEDIFEMIDYINYQSFVNNSCIKFVILLLQRKALKSIFMQLDAILPKTKADVAAYRLEEHLARVKYLRNAVLIIDLISVGLFTFAPLPETLCNALLFGGEYKWSLPFTVHYPFDEFKPTVYPFVYLYQVHAATIFVGAVIGADVLLCSIVDLLCMHFEYLANRISNFIPTGTDEDLKELFYFIKRHDMILRLSFEVNQLFNPIIFWNYFASGSMMVMNGFELITGSASDTFHMTKFMCLLIACTNHVWIFCYFGNNLIERSTELSDAVFRHSWFVGNAKYRKLIVLILARAQKPAHLTAFKFFVVSIESFQTLVSSAYQFLTLIQSQAEGV